MRPVLQADGSLQYDITVRSAGGDEEVYRTQESLFHPPITTILARDTRVWKAVRLDHGVEVGEPVVLKQAWVEDRRPREGTTMANIRARAHGDPVKEHLNSVLLTVLIHGDVAVEGMPDRTRRLPGDDRPKQPGVFRLVDPPFQRVHYRIVFKEFCKSLAEETSLLVITKAIADTSNGTCSLFN